MSDEQEGIDAPPADLRPDERQDSAVDPARLKRKKQVKLNEEQQAEVFWGRVFADPIGRREMWRLLQRLHPFDVRIGATPVGFPDERSTWMQLAEQLVGQHIYQEWFARFPQEVSLMRSENDQRFQKPKGG